MAPFAYIANSGDATVSVIDTAAPLPTVVNTLKVSGNPYGVAVSPDKSRVYVTVDPSHLTIIDTATHTVIAVVDVGSKPRGVAVTSDGKLVFVANNGSDTVTVIDTTLYGTPGYKPAILQQTNYNNYCATFGGPYGLAIWKSRYAGTRVYITNVGRNNVVVVDPAHLEWGPLLSLMPPFLPDSNTPLFKAPMGIGVTPYGDMYVSNSGGGLITATAEGLAAPTLHLQGGTYPNGVAITPDATRVYVAVSYVGVRVIDTATRAVVDTLSLPSFNGATGVSVTPNGEHLYVTNYSAKTVTVVKLDDGSELAVVPVGSKPLSIGQFI